MSDELESGERFFREGGVLVPGELAGLVADLARDGLRMTRRRVGGDVVHLLVALSTADLAHSRSARGPGRGSAGIVEAEGSWVSTSAASRRSGCSARHIRRLAERSRIRSKRVGRDWLIHLPSLDDYMRRTDDPGAGSADRRGGAG